jgi:type IV pilus assembly protein PilW
MKHRKQQGLSLIELLVALAIGAFLIIGAVTVQSQTRKTFTTNEQQARLQETARFALSVLEPDTQLAGLMGYSNDLAGTKFDPGDGSEPIAAKLMSTKAGAATGVPEVFNECGANFVVDVNLPIQAEDGDDGKWKMGCAAGGTGYLPGTDTLTIRRSSVEKTAPEAGRMQILSRRLKTDDSLLFANGVAPYAIKDDEAEVRDFLLKTYYVSPDSDGRPNLPSLRIKQIIAKDGAGAWDDQELVRGVEDIQVELGIDPGADLNADGVIDMEGGVATNVNGDVGRYVTPGDAIVASGQVVTVRLWIRVRAEEAEPGFIDRRSYKYANVDFQPNDGFRRVLMSRTIFVRNSRVFPTSGS